MINRSMIQSAVTMGQLQNKLDLIGSNLSNTATTGYKSRSADFSSLLFQQLNNQSHAQSETDRTTPEGVRIGAGARLGHANLDMSPGSLQKTGRDLDIALLAENHMFESSCDYRYGDGNPLYEIRKFLFEFHEQWPSNPYRSEWSSRGG